MLKPPMARLLRERKEALDEATDAFHDALIEAWKAGASLGEIGREIDSSHQHVSDVLARLGVRKKWRSVADANAELDRLQKLLDEQADK